MSDIALSWPTWLLLAPLLLPWLAVPGALLAGYVGYRRRLGAPLVLAAAIAGTFALPWAVLLGAYARDRARELGTAAQAGLWLGGGVLAVVLVIAALSRAGSRSRARR